MQLGVGASRESTIRIRPTNSQNAQGAPQQVSSCPSSSTVNFVINLVCSGLASGLIIGCLNPADTLRVRWQVGSSRATGSSIAKFAEAIVRKEGFNRGLLQPGLWPHVLSVGLCSSLRFTAYPVIRDALAGASTSSRTAGDGASASTAVAASILSGGLGYLTLAPLYLEKTRRQLEAIMAAASRSGPGAAPREAPAMFLSALWRSDLRAMWGSAGTAILVVRGAALSVGQLAGYDLAKKALVAASLGRHGGGGAEGDGDGRHQGEGPLVHALASVHAAFWATSLALPLDVLLVRDQARFVAGGGIRLAVGSRPGALPRLVRAEAATCGEVSGNHGLPSSRLVRLVRDTVRAEGARVFFRGWTPMFVRLSVFYATSNALFEEARRFAGLSYYG